MDFPGRVGLPIPNNPINRTSKDDWGVQSPPKRKVRKASTSLPFSVSVIGSLQEKPFPPITWKIPWKFPGKWHLSNLFSFHPRVCFPLPWLWQEDYQSHGSRNWLQSSVWSTDPPLTHRYRSNPNLRSANSTTHAFKMDWFFLCCGFSCWCVGCFLQKKWWCKLMYRYILLYVCKYKYIYIYRYIYIYTSKMVDGW